MSKETQKPMEENKTAEEYLKHFAIENKTYVILDSKWENLRRKAVPKEVKLSEILNNFAKVNKLQTSTLQKENDELRMRLSGNTFFDEKEAMQASIDSLKKRLEEAEKFLTETQISSNMGASGRHILSIGLSAKIKAFLTNKTE